MKTEPSQNNSKKVNLNNSIKDDGFINLINILSDSIREYYKVTKNANKNENILTNRAQKEINNFELYLKNNLKLNDKEINLFNGNINKILNNLDLNITSNLNNLTFFFEDAKIIFKKMKDERQEIISRMKKRANSNKMRQVERENILNKDSNYLYPKSENQRLDKINNNKAIYTNQNSAINFVIKKNIDNFDNFYKNNLTYNNNRISINNNIGNKIRNIKSYSKNKQNLKNMGNEISKKNYIRINTNNKNINVEIERLKDVNRQNELIINKLKNELKQYQLQDEKNLDNNKYNELLKNYKNCQLIIKKLQEENIKLKKNITPLLKNNINDDNKDLINKINILSKENNILKNRIKSLNVNNLTPKNELNYNIPSKKNSELLNINSLEKEIKLFNNKINSIEIKLLEEQKKNKELTKENILLNNKYKAELYELSKKNTEISKILLNKQNELLKLQKENMEKNLEIKNLKLSLNNTKYNSNAETIEEASDENNHLKISENANTNIYNYKKENAELKKMINTYQDKIKYYQNQIKNVKSGLYENVQAKIEQQNSNEKNMNEIKKGYEKKIEEINNKNKDAENNLVLCQTFNNELNQQINDLNQQIISKDIKILELNNQIEEIQKKLSVKEEENKNLIEKLNKNIDNNNNDDNRQNIILKDKLEEQKIINSDLNDELTNLKNNNELLTMNYEKNISKEKNKKYLNQELEKFNNENSQLKESKEKSKNEIKEILSSNKINGDNTKVLKDQNEELERLKQLISNYQTENQKGGEEIKNLKRENEKIKEQLIRLSTSLPEEYNQLLKEYKILETKYKNIIKNNKINDDIIGNQEGTSSTARNHKNEESAKELNKAKREIEVIKKKNMELVKQLEAKEINKNSFDNKSEQNISNYEEEFDLRKMAKGAKEKNRSQDINIDYPGIQAIKEKYRELDFYYNSLENLVKKLLLNIHCNPKNKVYITELCKLVKFDLETTNKIIMNKNKNFLLGIFK